MNDTPEKMRGMHYTRRHWLQEAIRFYYSDDNQERMRIARVVQAMEKEIKQAVDEAMAEIFLPQTEESELSKTDL